MAEMVALRAMSIEDVVVLLNPSKHSSIRKTAVRRLNLVDRAMAVID